MPLAGTLKNLLLRGVLAGLIAGLVAGGVAFALGEAHIEAAIAIEESAQSPTAHDGDEQLGAAHSHSGPESTPLVDRGGQRAGLILATTLAGIALGAVFAVAAHYLRRFTALSGPVLALALAGTGWLAVEAVPFFKYPANPPAVGDPDTLNERTLLWLAALALGIAAVAVSFLVAKATATQSLWSVRVTSSIAAFLAVVAVGYLLLPSVDEVGSDFPATLLWQFRISSLATQACLWLTLGLVFAVLTERADRSTARTAAPGGHASARQT